MLGVSSVMNLLDEKILSTLWQDCFKETYDIFFIKYDIVDKKMIVQVDDGLDYNQNIQGSLITDFSDFSHATMMYLREKCRFEDSFD